MFKQLDIDHDKVTLDGQIIKKPIYVSSEEWLSIWDILDPSVADKLYEEGYKEGYTDGCEDTSGKYESED